MPLISINRQLGRVDGSQPLHDKVVTTEHFDLFPGNGTLTLDLMKPKSREVERRSQAPSLTPALILKTLLLKGTNLSYAFSYSIPLLPFL